MSNKEWKVSFTYINTYRNRKGVTTFVTAATEKIAVNAARVRIEELYGISGATFKSATECAS